MHCCLHVMVIILTISPNTYCFDNLCADILKHLPLKDVMEFDFISRRMHI